MKDLWEIVENREPIKVYLTGDYYDTLYWDEEKQRYQGEFGFIPMEIITKIVLEKKEVDHIKIEGVE